MNRFGSKMNDQNKEPEEPAEDIWDSVEEIAKKIIRVIIRIIKGESIFMVSKLLGHRSVKTTEKYYADYKDENYRSATKRLE